MAVISNNTIWLEDAHHRIKIKVNSKGRFFHSVPQFIQDAMGVEELQGATLSEVECAFGELVEEYSSSSTETRLVINYEIQIAGNKRLTYDSDKLGDLGFSTGAGITVAAVLLEETITTSKSGHKTYGYSEVENDGHEDREGGDRFVLGDMIFDGSLCSRWSRKEQLEGLLEATPEMIAFFQRVSKSMDALVTRVANIFGDEKDLVTLAEKGGMFLEDKTHARGESNGS